MPTSPARAALSRPPVAPEPVASPATTPPPARRGPGATPYLFAVPTVLLLVAAFGYPVGWQLVTSFRKFGLAQQFGQPPEWVGLGNYTRLLQDSQLWEVVGRSVAFCLVCAFATVAVGGGVALLMNRVGPIVRLALQVAMLLAWAMPVVTVMTVWIWLVDWRRGLLNWTLEQLGFDAAGHNWLANPLSFFVIGALIVVWMSVPFVSLSLYAGLGQISSEIIEAAQLDGAGGWQRTRYIVMPMIRPVLSIVLLLQLIWDLRVFTQIKLLQDAGSVASETDLLGTFIYRLGTGSGDFGSAGAVSVFMLLLTVVVSWPYVRRLMREEAI